MLKSRLVAACVLLTAASLSYAQQMPARVVQISTVSRAEVAPTVAVPGTVYSRNEVQITAGVAGRLVMVAEPGTVVQQGDYTGGRYTYVDSAPTLGVILELLENFG